MFKNFSHQKSFFLNKRFVFLFDNSETSHFDSEQVEQADESRSSDTQNEYAIHLQLKNAKDVLARLNSNNPKYKELSKTVDDLEKELKNDQSTAREFLSLKLASTLNGILKPAPLKKETDMVFADDALVVSQADIKRLQDEEDQKMAEAFIKGGKPADFTFPDDAISPQPADEEIVSTITPDKGAEDDSKINKVGKI